MWKQKGNKKQLWVGKINYQQDLLESLQRFAVSNSIKCGRVEVIGAVEKAVVGYYNQERRIYEDLFFNEHLEITSCIGNISLRDGEPVAHMHITLGDRNGNIKGGHLQKGTIVFAGEFIIEEIIGPDLHREYDHATGLPLWSNK